MKVPFVGPSYKYRSVNFDAQQSVNLYPVKSETGDSKDAWALVGTPGLSIFTTLPVFPIRGCWNVNGRNFFVAGNALYEIFQDGTKTNRGTLLSSTGNVSISDNGQELCVVDGANGYVLTLSTNALTTLIIGSTTGWLGADTVTFCGGYLVFNKPDSGIYYISGLYDALTYDPLDFATAEGSPDNLVAVHAVHGQVWLLGDHTTEIVYNQGGADFPFAPIQGAFIEYGCVSAFSVASTANTIFWLGNDDDGTGMVWMATGYQPQRISTHAIEYAIQQEEFMGMAVGYTYQEDGHYFYILTFPSGKTWAYDITESTLTGQPLWHERAFFSNGVYSRARPICHVSSFNLHLVGDYESGNIYTQSLDIYTDYGNPIRRMRTAPYISDDLEYIYFHSFQLDMQTGIGLDGQVTGQGGFDIGFDSGFDIGGDDPVDPASNPQLTLDYSNDGHTYSNAVQASAGKIGQYGVRAIWRRLGRGRQRVFRVVFSAPCKVFWIAAHISMEKGTN